MAEPTGYINRGLFSFTPSIQIDELLVKEVQSAVEWSDKRGFVAIDTSTDPSLEQGYVKLPTWGKINNEIVEIVSLVDDPDGAGQTLVMNRGILDTTPQEHAIGSILWFAGDWMGVDPTEWVTGETVWAKAALTGPSFETPLDKVVPMPISVSGRAALPYAPGQFKINGGYWPATASGDLTITWAHRDRLQQTAPSVFTDQTDGNVGPEDGTTYVLTARNETTGVEMLEENVGDLTTHTLESGGTGFGEHKYWRIIVDEPDNVDQIAIYECELRDTPDGASLCTGGTATASSYSGTNYAYKAFDGEITTRWNTNSFTTGTDVVGQWLAYEFAAPESVIEIMFKSYVVPSIFMTGWTVQHSDNGADWTTAWVTTGETEFGWVEERTYLEGTPGWSDGDELTITIASVRGGLGSYQIQEHTLICNLV